MPVGEHLRVGVSTHADVALVQLDGELDLASAPVLESRLEEPEVAGAATVVLDLREVQFIDSTGLRTIFAARSSCRQRGQELAVTRGSEQVQRLLSITRMGEQLRLIDTPEEILPTHG
ncbi:MAG TPA: STAS domain-containing protein [Solirubrobacteraceae bacterium]|nr:STAS domain-containing protein [Solirubrobacteraceae bacterium]